METGEVKAVHGGCVVAKGNLEVFKAAAESLNIPVKILRDAKRYVVVDMDRNQYAMVEATVQRARDALKL